jgi:hypothetical protein
MAKVINSVEISVGSDEKPPIKGRFVKGKSGNPSGRRAGSRGKATLAALLLLDDECEKLTRCAIDQALTGDSVALKMCLDRLIPIRKDHPVNITLPKINGLQDLVGFTSALLTGVSEGLVGATEAEKLCKIVTVHREVIQATDFESRIAELESQANIKRRS